MASNDDFDPAASVREMKDALVGINNALRMLVALIMIMFIVWLFV